MVEQLSHLDVSNGIPALLASICVIMTLSLLTRVGEFVWKFLKRKSDLTEKSIAKLTTALDACTSAIGELKNDMKETQVDLAVLPKFKTDLNRLYRAVKIVAGEDWAAISKEIMDDGPLN